MLLLRLPYLPRHPLGRLLFAIAGFAIGAIMLFFGLAVGALVLGVWITLWLLRKINHAVHRQSYIPEASASSSRPNPRVIDGEYVVVQRDRPPV